MKQTQTEIGNGFRMLRTMAEAGKPLKAIEKRTRQPTVRIDAVRAAIVESLRGQSKCERKELKRKAIRELRNYKKTGQWTY